MEHELSFGNRLGVFIIVEAGVVSFIFVAVLLSVVALNALYHRFLAGDDQQPRWKFLRSAGDYYILCLIAFDLLLAAGQVMDAYWVGKGTVVSGRFCRAQGAVQQVGDVGVALTSLVVCCHTFTTIFFRWPNPSRGLVPSIVISSICVFLIISTIVPAITLPEFWDVSGNWCWISPHRYKKQWIGLEYVFIWAAMIAGFLIYIPVFLRLRGNIVIQPRNGRVPKVSWAWVKKVDAWNMSNTEKRERDVARQMLAYPIAYTILYLAQSVMRILQLERPNWQPPSAAAAIAGALFACSGMVNVTLYLITRPSVFEFIIELIRGAHRATATTQPPPEVQLRLTASFASASEAAGLPNRDRQRDGISRTEQEERRAPVRLEDDDCASLVSSVESQRWTGRRAGRPDV
ncbi:hypothetical protein FRB95_007857 [Tulasnella sp. JGI-2019a]|nr:hypothetical protein FRB93_005247 [Tulasnella sp. JGI-2019a]KAG9027343.1 hypothetical protein FRB95_007857 [Tulasnella sp. JGI-2019a]